MFLYLLCAGRRSYSNNVCGDAEEVTKPNVRGDAEEVTKPNVRGDKKF